MYKKLLDEGKLPIYKGMKLTKDDKIRRHLVNDIRTYFKIDFQEIENIYEINFRQYFDKELKNLSEHTKDELVSISSDCLSVTELGENFAPQIANVFDKYDPPTTSYSERLKKINTVLAHPS